MDRLKAFNPLAPCGASPPLGCASAARRWLSIHSPLAGRDDLQNAIDLLTGAFQSTRPLRGETKVYIPHSVTAVLSIHSPLAGRDCFSRSSCSHCASFNPLAPCGARQAVFVELADLSDLSIHSPLAGRDASVEAYDSASVLSIHSPLAGRDAIEDNYEVRVPELSIHSPLAGRDRGPAIASVTRYSFNPLAPCGARRSERPDRRAGQTFNPLAPCGARPVTSSPMS